MRIPSPMGETPGSSSGGEGQRQVVRDVGSLHASSPELEREQGATLGLHPHWMRNSSHVRG